MNLPTMRKILCFFILLSYITAIFGCTRNAPVNVTLTQLYRDPATYNHKLIKISGVISHGFEQFILTDPHCPPRCGIWLEYGGQIASGTMYCCGISAKRARAEILKVEEIPVPLVNDKLFQRFDELNRREPNSVIKATLIGRFFAGKKSEFNGEVEWGGYGHFGCCSLLAIQQVVSIDE